MALLASYSCEMNKYYLVITTIINTLRFYMSVRLCVTDVGVVFR